MLWARTTLQFIKESCLQKGGSIICSLHAEDQVQEFADFAIRLNSHDPASWAFEPVNPILIMPPNFCPGTAALIFSGSLFYCFLAVLLVPFLY